AEVGGLLGAVGGVAVEEDHERDRVPPVVPFGNLEPVGAVGGRAAGRGAGGDGPDGREGEGPGDERQHHGHGREVPAHDAHAPTDVGRAGIIRTGGHSGVRRSGRMRWWSGVNRRRRVSSPATRAAKALPPRSMYMTTSWR